MSTFRSEASSYTTFCETVHQIPVILISDLRVVDKGTEKPFYISIDSMVGVKNRDPIDCWSIVYWRTDLPPQGSLLHGAMHIGVNTEGLVFTFERLNIEIRPGNVSDPLYRTQHFAHTPIQIRAFGKVLRKDKAKGLLAIEVETYIPTGKSRFEVHYRVPEHLMSSLPEPGAYAGGRGPLLSVTPVVEGRSTPPPALEVELQSLHVGVTLAAAVRPKNDPGRQEWLNVFTKQTNSPTARVPVHNPTRTNVTTLTTFAEVYCRFMVVKVLQISPITLTVRTVTTNAHAYDFTMNWPLAEAPLPHTIFSMIGAIGTPTDQLVIEAAPETLEVRSGHPKDHNYRHFQLLTGPCRMRAAGKVVASTKREFTIVGFVSVNGASVPFQVRFLVPDTPRWRKFQGCPLGHFVSGRGTLASFTEGSNATAIVDIDHLTNAPVGQEAQCSSSASSTPPVSAWDAPATAQGRSIDRGGSNPETAIQASAAEHRSMQSSPWDTARSNQERHGEGSGSLLSTLPSSRSSTSSSLFGTQPSGTSTTPSTPSTLASISPAAMYKTTPHGLGSGLLGPSPTRSGHISLVENRASASTSQVLDKGNKRPYDPQDTLNNGTSKDKHQRRDGNP